MAVKTNPRLARLAEKLADGVLAHAGFALLKTGDTAKLTLPDAFDEKIEWVVTVTKKAKLPK